MDQSILFLNKGPEAASTRFRASQYHALYEQAGWRSAELPCNDGFSARLSILFQARKYRWVVIQRKLFGPVFLRMLTLLNPNVVFDFDDAIFLKSSGKASPRRLRRFSQVARRAKLIWAGNTYLAETARKHAEQEHAADVHCIPTALDLQRYQQIKKEHVPATGLRLIWIGSRSTQRYLEEFRQTFEAIGQQISDLELMVVADFDFSLENISVESIDWSPERELEALARADVGIAPMSDNPWTRGKCAFKLLQYMAAGLPVVSSDCGANAEVVDDGVSGFLAEGAEQWVAALQQLMDPEKRSAQGRAASYIIAENFTREVCFSKMLMSLEGQST